MTIQNSGKKVPVRVRNELKFRELTVKSKDFIANTFFRIVFSGPQLADFSSRGFDDHIKVFFPAVDSAFTPPQITDEGIVWGDGPRPQSRDYTPLDFDAVRQELTIDFYLHEDGVASNWARDAKPGDKLTIGGPRGSLVIPTDYRWQLYICDESGLPAVRRRLQSLPADARPLVLVNCHKAESLSYLEAFTSAQVQALKHDEIVELLKELEIPAEDYFIWIVGEGQQAKQLGDYLLDVRGLDVDLVRTVAYWHGK
ncbi:NADPH-dependent ferric-chelate reductase [Cedecea davisae]|uniref:Siderophore-interacting FAD-binding domain protein n=1 Tax=Cedecea davisae DSM 4568 TaxID=566551 RepID=S3IV78_9ENTR|nr:siderophore-interacting protein [Cedecea davisae]EPF16880.1 Siderophore-interacting FAD-binding domain protein [Cedecea davisae DSM 4568]SUX27689.1 NADPH-dependent ferric-chelate reductase [Cedecea davisae]